jgi:glutathione transport system permease protein
VVQGCILFIVLFFLLINMLVDVLCAVIDPRIKYS